MSSLKQISSLSHRQKVSTGESLGEMAMEWNGPSDDACRTESEGLHRGRKVTADVEEPSRCGKAHCVKALPTCLKSNFSGFAAQSSNA